MSAIEQEVASQPDVWRQAAALAASAPLPRAGTRIAVVGCGTSLYIAQAYAAAREAAGQGETDAFAASEFPFGRRYDRVLALSRSGTTTEVLAALETLRDVRTVAITADPTTPIMDAADDVVVLDFADERSVVQTWLATSVLTLLRETVETGASAVAARDAQRALQTELLGAQERLRSEASQRVTEEARAGALEQNLRSVREEVERIRRVQLHW